MPAFPIRHRRITSLVGVVLALGVLTGCPYQRDPDSYGDGVRESFVNGCDGTAFAGDDGPGADVEAAQIEAASLPTPQCECMYDEIEANIEFDRFSDVYSDQRENPGTLPPDIQQTISACDAAGNATGS